MTEFTNKRPRMDEAHYVRPQAAWERMNAARNSRQIVYMVHQAPARPSLWRITLPEDDTAILTCCMVKQHA